MKGISLEARVGMLVLIALVILGAFVFVLGGFRLGSGYDVFVDFDNPGNVKPGAPVNIGGIKVGSVEEISYRGGEVDPETGRRSLVRIRLDIDDSVRDTIHDNALFYVSSQSLLGEQMIAIDPGDADRPVLPEGSVVRGVDPPRLDLALALGYELLEDFVTLVRNNRDDLQNLLQDIVGFLHALNEIFSQNRGHIDSIIASIDAAAQDTAGLARSARDTVDGAEAHRIVRNLDHTLAAVSRDIDPILRDTRLAVTNLNGTLESVGPEQQEEIRNTIHNANQLAERANRAVGDAQAVVAHIRQGRGSVGALLMDEEIYDDLQEMLRDLKHNPWKFFWRE